MMGESGTSWGSPRHLGLKGEKVRARWQARRREWMRAAAQSWGADTEAEDSHGCRRGGEKPWKGLKPAWHSLADQQWSLAALHGQQDESVSVAKGAWKERSFRHRDVKGQGFWSVLVVTTEGKGLVLTCSAVAQGHGLFIIIVLPLWVIGHSAC